jgi:hypothetical protein
MAEFDEARRLDKQRSDFRAATTDRLEGTNSVTQR